jgi:16S rRNA processing protein RimM
MAGQRPEPDPEGHVRVGQIVGPFGIKGGLKVVPLTDFPERFDVGSLLYLGGEPLTVASCHWHKTQARVVFVEIRTVEQAEALKWRFLTVPATERPELDDGEYLASDLVGMSVVERGNVVGVVDEVVQAPAQDLIRVGDTLIPLVRQFVKSVDIESKKIEVELIEGLRPGQGEEDVR